MDECESSYKGNMERNGYSSIYIQRGGHWRDGCGMFFKHGRYVDFVAILKAKYMYSDLN